MRFIINANGIGGKFSFMPLTMTLGGGVGLMSLSVIIADVVMLYCTKEKRLYQKIKTKKLEDKERKEKIFNHDEDLNVDVRLQEVKRIAFAKSKDLKRCQKTLKIRLNSLSPIHSSV